MRFYFVSDTSSSRYYGTLTEAHRAAKQPYCPGDGTGYMRDWVLIQEIELPTGKADLLRLLNEPGLPGGRVRREWEVTRRGGLRLLPAKAEGPNGPPSNPE